jgi:hypothetical protein
MVEWLGAASDNELLALFENHTLGDSFLADLLKRGNGWDGIADDRLCAIVSILHRNPRMRTAREDDYMDGHSEYSYGSVFNAAWSLAGTAPATNGWAFGLGWLYEQLQPDAFSIKEPLELAARWHVDPSDADAVREEVDSLKYGYLGNKQRVRKGLARLALHKSGKRLAELVGHTDVAFRCAAYSAGALSSDQLRAAFELDGELAFNELLRNLSLWGKADTRQELHDIAWATVRADKTSDLMAANQFNSMAKDMRKKHPAWFADEDGGEARGDDGDDLLPVTKSDIASLATRLDKQSKGFEAVSDAVRILLSRTSWIWWFALGGLAASLKHL